MWRVDLYSLDRNNRAYPFKVTPDDFKKEFFVVVIVELTLWTFLQSLPKINCTNQEKEDLERRVDLFQRKADDLSNDPDPRVSFLLISMNALPDYRRVI